MKALCLDPSVNNCGWATFKIELCQAKDTQKKTLAWKWGTLHPRGRNLEEKMYDLLQQVEETVGPVDFLITEKPTFFSSERGQIAAHQSYTIDLAAVSYYIAGWLHMDHRHHFAITANQWKGSVPKAITARRFFKSFPKVDPKSLSEHAIDAAMLMRFWLENFAIYSPLINKKIDPKSILALI